MLHIIVRREIALPMIRVEEIGTPYRLCIYTPSYNVHDASGHAYQLRTCCRSSDKKYILENALMKRPPSVQILDHHVFTDWAARMPNFRDSRSHSIEPLHLESVLNAFFHHLSCASNLLDFTICSPLHKARSAQLRLNCRPPSIL